MSTLAHEGNPKEDSITISGGSVLSTAQLDINFEFFGDASAVVVPQAADQSGSQSYSCSDVFNWGPGDELMTWSESPCNSSSGDITRSFDTNGVVTIHSSPLCYGIVSAAFPGVSSPQNMAFSCSLFGAGPSGAPVCGPCLNAPSDATYSSASCIAIVVDWSTGTTYFMQWSAGTLQTLSGGTVLYSASYTPSAGDYFYLASIQNGSETTVTGKIYSEGGFPGSQQWGSDVTLSLTPLARAGFVAIGENTEGTVVFGHSANQSCHGSVTMFAYSEVTFV